MPGFRCQELVGQEFLKLPVQKRASGYISMPDFRTRIKTFLF